MFRAPLKILDRVRTACARENFSACQFAVFRIVFGFYLLVYCLKEYPFAADLFSAHGALTDPTLNPTHRVFPDWLLRWDSVRFVKILFWVKGVASFLFLVGFLRRPSAFVIWAIMCWSYNRNNFIDSPEYAMVGWMLLATLFLPKGEPLSAGKRNPSWRFPTLLRETGILLMGISYTYSGYSKFGTPAWLQGTALRAILVESDVSRSWVFPFLTSVPEWIFVFLTFLSLGLELLGAPAMYFRKSRLPYWSLMLAFQFGILMAMDLTELTLGMIFLNLFIFDPAWVASPKQAAAIPQS